MKRIKLLTFLLAFTILLTTMLPTVVFAQGNDSGTSFEVGDSVELKEAFKKIENTEGTYTISLKEDITVEGESYSVSLKKGREVTLLGNGHTIYFKNKYGSLQTNGGTLNLGNESANKLTLDATGTNRREAVIEIFGGTVNMYDHVTIKGNDNAQKSTMGGGVNVESASFAEYGDSTFNMYGGVITECKNQRGTGGGVSVVGVDDANGLKATFNMYGGSITGNEAITPYTGSNMYGGGGVAVLKTTATFNMYDGLIEGNKAVHCGGGIYSCLGAVNIEGGAIRNNTCDSVIGTTYGSGGGIYSYYGTTTIKNAVIEGNYALYGGGIYAYVINYSTKYPGKITISKSNIQNNIASRGGGVYASYSKDVRLSDSTINSNEAHNGGGILASKSTITFENSEVSGNKAYTGSGGGLYVSSASTVSTDSKGNIICNNTAGGYAADVYLKKDSIITLPNAKDMDKEYLADNQNFRIDGWYWDAADSRYTPSEDGETADTDNTTSGLALVASYRVPGMLVVTYELQEGEWTETRDIYSEQDGKYIENVPLREKANEPSAPEKEGYVFGGWYTDSNYSDESEYDFSAPVTRHITLYAKWLKKMEPLNAVPAIMAEDKTLTVGDTFDPLKDVTASDTEDGDLTAKIEVLRSNVDTSKAGTYQVTYKVMDSMGASATKTITVTVKAKDTQKPTTDDNEKPSATDTDKKPISTDKQTTSNSPKTGDSTNMTTWLALMFVSLGLLAGIFTVRKLRKSR